MDMIALAIIISELIINGEFPEGEKILYKYDKNGNKIEETTIFLLDGKEYKMRFQYDKFNRLESKMSMDKNDSINYKFEYQYNEKGNLINEITYTYIFDSVRISKYEYQYDDQNNLIETINYEDNDIISRKESCKYDEFGNLIESNSYSKYYDEYNKTEYIFSR